LQWPRFEELFAARRERLAKSEPVLEIGSDAFATSVLEADRPVLVDFSATWCGPCKRQAPILDKMARGSEGRFRIVKVDIDASPDLAERYDAQSVPTLVVFAKGAEVARTVGLSQAEELAGLLAKADA
jgi:thioredoxin 1